MSKKLIITEKPSVARDFARVLKVNGSRNGYIENEGFVITWCVGHLVEMLYPEAYDVKFKRWNIEDLPFLPDQYLYGVIKNVKEQYEIVNTFLHREDIDVVYWAGDSGKEGQTIEENIRMYGGVRPGMEERRVWIDSQTDDEILRGLREAKLMSDYANLGKSGIMRSIEDYSLGINFSRALSVKYGRLVNDAAATKSYSAIAVGRVMTCVLGMVVTREREIRHFVETPFFRIQGIFGEQEIGAEWKVNEKSKYFDSPLLYKENGFKKSEDARQFIDSLDGKKATVRSIEKSNVKKKAPLLYNLAELQAECSKIFKISPNETLQVAQDLYEKKLTTYPRTDARVLTSAIAKEIYKNLYKLKGYQDLQPFVDKILEEKLYVGLEKTQYTDDSKVTDHYAIIPTGQTGELSRLSPLHKNVYNLIVKRFLSIFYPPAVYLQLKLTIGIEEELFYTSAKILKEEGYMQISGVPSQNQNDEDNVNNRKKLLQLSDQIKKDDEIEVKGFELKEGKTSPPKRYTSGTLILAMENAGNLIEDEDLRAQIKNTGIGTSATRAGIIDKLIHIGYLNLNKKSQIITPEKLGEMIYEVVKMTVSSLLNPEMTANWEKGLEGISNGTIDADEYRRKMEAYIKRETEAMKERDLTEALVNVLNPFTGRESKGVVTRRKLGIPCPVCGGELTTTSFGYGCSNYWDKEKPCQFNVGNIAGVHIEEEDFKSLILNGETRVIDGFVGSKKNAFKAALKLVHTEDGKAEVQFDFSKNPIELVENLSCPVCGAPIEKTGYGFICQKCKEDRSLCYFSISKIASRSLSEEELRSLITNGKTEVLSGFVSKNKKKFSAALVLSKQEDERLGISFDFTNVEPEKLKAVKCPNCGGDILVTGFGYRCSNYSSADENSCKFAVGKIAGKALNASQMTELLTQGKTKTIRGFKSKTGKKFDACLALEKKEGAAAVVFNFDEVEAKAVSGVVCPNCGGKIVKTPFGFGCSNYSKDNPDSCRFSIGKIASKTLTEAAIRELLTNGTTSLIQGFMSKSNKPFDAKLTLDKDENGKVKGLKFVFEDVLTQNPGISTSYGGSATIDQELFNQLNKEYYEQKPNEGEMNHV